MYDIVVPCKALSMGLGRGGGRVNESVLWGISECLEQATWLFICCEFGTVDQPALLVLYRFHGTPSSLVIYLCASLR